MVLDSNTLAESMGNGMSRINGTTTEYSSELTDGTKYDNYDAVHENLLKKMEKEKDNP